jgi:hypothetical protein
MVSQPSEDYPRVVTAYAEPAAGPGWANAPLWVIVEDVHRKMRMECIQPEDQTKEIRMLYSISHNVHAVLTDEAEKILKKSPRWKTEKKEIAKLFDDIHPHRLCCRGRADQV